jgi:hypothetical protein
MREENRKVWDLLAHERRKVDKLVGVVLRMHELISKTFPGNG